MGKVIGAVLVLAGSMFVGIYSSVIHNRELTLLQRFMGMLDYMTCELQYRLAPLPELCRLVSKEGKGELAAIFCELADELEQQISPNAKSCMLSVLMKHDNLPQSSRKLLDQLGSALGRFDLPGQLKGLEAVRRSCRVSINALNDNKDERLRAYRTLGLCAGAALVILLV